MELATFVAWPRVLHGMPIRDLWAPPQLGRLPTCVAMYFPTPSATAVDRSLFTGLFPPHSPTQYALSSSLFSLQFFLLLLSPTPSSCTLSSHRFESSLTPPFPPHCNSLLVGSSPIHPPLPAMSSRSLRYIFVWPFFGHLQRGFHQLLLRLFDRNVNATRAVTSGKSGVQPQGHVLLN
jgi:hypothetical protein